jgi:hypothetical protein
MSQGISVAYKDAGRNVGHGKDNINLPLEDLRPKGREKKVRLMQWRGMRHSLLTVL